MPQAEGESKIELVHNLDLNKLLDNADKNIGQGRSGHILLFSLKENARKYSPAAIEFRPRNRKEFTPGFWILERNSGSTLERSAVIFDSKDRSITFIDLGPDGEISGIKIDHKLRAIKISGPLNEFPKVMLDARKKARNYCRKIDALRK